tara:strand:+ start:1799 stop:2287 length:489 start_codon:yes stop_codon:yes gene_type:complete
MDNLSILSKKHWIIRVGDGINFRNSKYPFWGVVRGRCGSQKTNVKKIKKGDILWFLTSKKYGAKIIGMSEYCEFYDREDEPLIQINTMTNEQQNWIGNIEWDIQIHYCNFYNTEKQNITGIFRHPQSIIDYYKFKDCLNKDLDIEYNNFKTYAEPKIFNNNL